jgi:exodeoxyribonuclease III
MRVVSWNINGLRGALRRGLATWLATARPDVLCLQETRVDPVALPSSVRNLAGYHSYWAAAQRPGYAGVATYCREPASSWQAGLGIERFDAEGRVVRTELADLCLYNVYFPNGKASPARLAYKLDFYASFLAHVDAQVKDGRNVVFCGDVNTAHRPIDLARPAANARRSGFLPEERAWLDRWIAHGWVDTFRALHGDVAGAYTWWDPRTRARDRNVGWRLDYCFVHASLLPRVKDAGICPDVLGSDHCPIWLDL